MLIRSLTRWIALGAVTTLLVACSGNDSAGSDGLTAADGGDDAASTDDDTNPADDTSADDAVDDDAVDDDAPAGGGTAGDTGEVDIDASVGVGGDGAGGTGTGGSGGASGGGSGGANGGGANAGGGGGANPGGAAGMGGTGGLGPMCFPVGFSCEFSADCCSGLCDPNTQFCESSLAQCTPDGQDCTAPTDCCSLACVNGTCGGQCTSDNQPCTEHEQCCGGVCQNDSCLALNFECKTSGNECSSGTECCSSVCDDTGRCDLGVSYCIQEGDVCSRPTDCCAGICSLQAGATVGTCGAPPQGAANCGGVHGSVCNSCGECCSSLCAPYGSTGVFICQPPSGCHVTGELCRLDSDCCGGVPPEDYPSPDDVLPGAGNVSCDIRDNNDVGVCRNAMGCSPQGNVCHYQDYACNNSSAPNSCCGGLGNSGVCQLDFLGIPRCYGLDACREPGDICASSADCCFGLPCVPAEDGFLHCAEDACIDQGESCTSTSDCCPGTTCIQAPGSLAGVCGESTPPGGEGGTPGNGGAGVGGASSGGNGTGGSPAGGGAGPGGAPGSAGAAAGGSPAGGSGGSPQACSEYGQFCDPSQPCCNAVPCNAGRCIFPIP